MALKRQNELLATYSMASMTDVIFLLLIFFMVTSTLVFPTALEVNLPQSSEQTAIKPGTRVYIDKDQTCMPRSARQSRNLLQKTNCWPSCNSHRNKIRRNS